MTPLSALVDGALDRVVDPCSNAIGSPLGLREMGLAHHVEIDAERRSITVHIRVTSPCCAFGPHMAAAARRELEALPGVAAVRVELDYTAIWTPTDIAPRAAARLESRRATTVSLTGVRPHDWTGTRVTTTEAG